LITIEIAWYFIGGFNIKGIIIYFIKFSIIKFKKYKVLSQKILIFIIWSQKILIFIIWSKKNINIYNLK